MTWRRTTLALGLGSSLFAGRAAGGAELWRADPRFDALVPAGTQVETLARGFGWVEGPVWDARAGRLLFSDVAANAVFEWRDGTGVKRLFAPSGWTGAGTFPGREPGSNGLAFDAQGRLLLCQHGDRRLARREPDGRFTVLAERYRGRRLNSPNDLALRANGELWFTDPPFGLPAAFDDPAKELDWSGIFRLAPDGKLELVTRKLRAPNGLAFSPDERTLYVSNSDPAEPRWMAFPVRENGTLGRGRVFFDARSWARRWPGLPDGFAIDARGHVFAAGPGGVHVFTPEGRHLGSILLGVATSNVTFGGDGSELFVTAGSAVHRVRLATTGLAWASPPADERKPR